MENWENRAFVFKITLSKTAPQIWRRISVPATSTFHQLQQMIQISMGWHGTHLHHFEMKHPTSQQKIEFVPYTKRYEYLWKLMNFIDGRTAKICDFFTPSNRNAIYMYDFEDSWEHTVEFEKCFYSTGKGDLRRCIDGQGVCPPEDCGGVSGFYDLVYILGQPDHPDYKEVVDELEQRGVEVNAFGGEFDPKSVNPMDIELRAAFNNRFGSDF